MEAVGIVEHDERAEVQSFLPISDSERFDDVERPVGSGRLSADVLDIRGYESGRDAIDCEFDVSGAVP